MAKRNASGAGGIRQRPDGRWEARYTSGRDPGTGKQVQKSVYGTTQDEVVKKLRHVLTSIDTGTHVEPSKMTVGAWLDVWTAEYLHSTKDATQASYKGHIKNHIRPALGAVKLQHLKPHQIQGFYNSLLEAGLSPKTVRNIHGIIHSMLDQALKVGYIRSNPSEACTLPRWVKKEMRVMNDEAVTAFLQAIQGDPYEGIYFIDLFTVMRQSETLGLTWGAVDFTTGTITVSKQLLRERKAGGKYYLDTPKNDKVRKIKPANIVMQKLKEQKHRQTEWRLKAGPAWVNPMDLVFTNELGQHLVHLTVYRHYKAIVAGVGEPDLRFHDMRHSYAVVALMNGDDIKTVQGNLGHHSAAFTLDVYAHVTEKMQEESAARMDAYIQNATKEKA
ncbi:tyrosine-type recombinase/integrase [Ruminococcaceae bacterium OttesenSCG-928-D13]|nr:tyrosine-type recombinase/integrase [Ruminococcaceae bacterium OttesenSCG-928-D13]